MTDPDAAALAVARDQIHAHTDGGARAHAHAAVLAALEGDPHGLAQDILDGAERNGHTPELTRYLVALTGGVLSQWLGERLSSGQVVEFTRQYFRTLEGGDS